MTLWFKSGKSVYYPLNQLVVNEPLRSVLVEFHFGDVQRTVNVDDVKQKSQLVFRQQIYVEFDHGAVASQPAFPSGAKLRKW